MWRQRLLICQIEKVFEENHRVYGYRKMQRALAEKNILISVYQIRKLMRENGFYPQIVTKYKPYYSRKSDGQNSPNHLRQNFAINAPNKIWVGDITYIKTVLGWVYLAAVIDLYNREVVGYAISKQIDTELAKQALGNAICGREKLQGLIFHSDRGCQYSSKSFRKMLDENSIISSMSRPGCPYDNSCMESFFASLKKECIYRRHYATMDEVKRDVFSYVELFYNRKRLHSYLGYLSPVEYKRKHWCGDVA